MSSAEPVFRGAGVALVTLFDDSGTADVTATVAHAVAVGVVGRGVRGVLVAGTAGEFCALTESERTDLVRGAREALPGSLGALADVAPELSVTAFAGDAAAQRRLAPVERSALQRFPLGLKKILHEQAGTSTALGRGTAELLERSA
jgi:dihydrodipicolinate synthase/N-acetylneuraminate lyase